jgi:hypothetical protein
MSLSLWSRIGSAALCTMALGAAPAFADVVFTDDSFDLADYTPTSIFQSGPSAGLVYASAGGTLQFVSTFTDLDLVSDVAMALFDTDFVINPATQGTPTSIDASVDKDNTDSITIPTTGTFTNTFRPAIEQDGSYYLAAIAGPSLTSIPGTTGYNLLSATGLTAADFVSFNFSTGTFGTAHPNFAGDPMEFGLAQITSVRIVGGEPPLSIYQAILDYKDLTLDVVGAKAVPEPSTLALLGLSAIGMGWLSRRRARLFQ